MRWVLLILAAVAGCATPEGDDANSPAPRHVEVTGGQMEVEMAAGPFQVLSCTYGDYGEVCREVTDQYAIVEGFLCLATTPDVCDLEAANETGRLLVYRM